MWDRRGPARRSLEPPRKVRHRKADNDEHDFPLYAHWRLAEVIGIWCTGFGSVVADHTNPRGTAPNPPRYKRNHGNHHRPPSDALPRREWSIVKVIAMRKDVA